MVCVQRSTGYAWRKAITVDQIAEWADAVHKAHPDIVTMADNCYGEFIDVKEPTQVGVDIMAGSLIKNPGGGLALSGGYVAGRNDLVDTVQYRMTCPGIGGECGATLGNNRQLFQGLFLAPHTVAQALKTVVFCSAMMEAVPIAMILSVTIYSWLVTGAFLNFVFIPNNKYYYITRNQIVALISCLAFIGIGLWIEHSMLCLAAAISLSGLVEIVYCRIVSQRMKLL